MKIRSASFLFLLSVLCSSGLSCESSGTEVLVNLVAYDVGGPKRFVVQSSFDSTEDGTFQVKRYSDDMIMFEGTLLHKGGISHWKTWKKNNYWTGDFTSLDAPGDYFISAQIPEGSADSHRFRIGYKQLYVDTARLGGYLFAKDRQSPDGGWYMDWLEGSRNTLLGSGPILYGLIILYEQDPAFWEQWDELQFGYEENTTGDISPETMELVGGHPPAGSNGIVDIEDQIMWGLLQLKDMQIENGSFRGSSGRVDDIFAGWGISCFAKLSQAPYLSESENKECLSRAKLAWEYYEDDFTCMWSDSLHVMYGLRILADLDLYEADDHDQKYMDHARMIVDDHLLPEWDAYNKNFFADGDVAACLAQFIYRYPEEVPLEVIDKLETWIEEYIINPGWGADQNPFGITTARESSFFFHNLSSDWPMGENSRYLSNAWAGFWCYRVFGDIRYSEFAWNHLHWIFGMQPSGECMMNDIGSNTWDHWHGRMGDNTGAIPNGLLGMLPTDDSPVFDFDWRTNEPWSHTNGQFILAMCAGYTGDIRILQSDYATEITEFEIGDMLYFQLDATNNSSTIDRVTVVISGQTGYTSDSENLTLIETFTNTGIYRGQMGTVQSETAVPNNGTLESSPGEQITVAYGSYADTAVAVSSSM